MRSAQQIIHRYIVRRPNPLHILMVISARDSKDKTCSEDLIDNFCQRPGRMNLDH